VKTKKLFIICSFILIPLFVIFLFNRYGSQERVANERIEQAISRIEIIADDESLTLGPLRCLLDNCQHFRCRTGGDLFDNIYATVDFENLLFENENGERRHLVYYHDFNTVRGDRDNYLARLYGDLSRMFERASNVTINTRNIEVLMLLMCKNPGKNRKKAQARRNCCRMSLREQPARA